MGLLSMWKKAKKEFDEQTPTPGPTIGGGPLSISKAMREFKEQPVQHVRTTVTDERHIQLEDTQAFLFSHVQIGVGHDGIPIFRRRTPEELKAMRKMMGGMAGGAFMEFDD